jgi:hypothetical protein
MEKKFLKNLVSKEAGEFNDIYKKKTKTLGRAE